MHDQTAHILRRADRLLSELLLPARWRNRVPLRITAWEVPDEPVTFAEATGQEFTDFEVGQPWSRPWGTTWFRLTGQVPADWNEPGTRAEAMIDLGFTGAGPGFQAEGTGWTPDGAILKGIEPLNNHLPVGPPGSVTVRLRPFQVCTLRIHR